MCWGFLFDELPCSHSRKNITHIQPAYIKQNNVYVIFSIFNWDYNIFVKQNSIFVWDDNKTTFVF